MALPIGPGIAACTGTWRFLPKDLALREPGGADVLTRSGHEREYRLGLQRFLDEARTLAKFKHPNIVRVTDHFEANNTAYLVMDYERGRSLSQRRRSPHRPPGYRRKAPGPLGAPGRGGRGPGAAGGCRPAVLAGAGVARFLTGRRGTAAIFTTSWNTCSAVLRVPPLMITPGKTKP